MLSQCPHCHNQLQLSEAQQEKVKQALAALPEGKTLKIACPICKQPIHLRRDGSVVEEGGQPTAAAPEATATPATPKSPPPPPKPVNPPPTAPAPPDIGWLQSGEEADDLEEVVRDVPLAMVLMADGEPRRQVAGALEAEGFQVEFPELAAAKERMRFVNFAAVVLHSDFTDGDWASSDFHRYMRQMPSAGRRLLLYVLIGPQFKTLYDLEALAHSANLVVNDADVAKFPLILKKARHDYQTLFGPYLEALKEHGKLG